LQKKENVNKGHKWVCGIFTIKPSTGRCICHLVNRLPQNLNGWLRTIRFFVGHVEVINHDHTKFTHCRTEDTFASAIELSINEVLGLCALALGRETHHNWHEVFFWK
jgi:hypothetical protein